MSTIRTGMAAAARCLALDQLGADAGSALQRAGIEVVLLKGAGLARRLYRDDPDRRRYSDVDLLVAPETFDQAERVLAQLGLDERSAGMREDEQHWYERSWRLPGPQALTVDLHRSFAGVGDPAAFWAAISASTEPLELAGVVLAVPDAAGCALVVGLHAAVPGPGRKPLTDLLQALALLPDPVWDRAAQLARLTRSTGAFARGLSRDPGGRAQVARLQLTATSTLAEDLIVRQVGGVAISLARLQEQFGPRAKVRFVLRRLFHSQALMRRCHPIANRGPVGLAAAYALRFGRLAALTPSAVLAVRRARRGGSSPSRWLSRWRAVRAVADLDTLDRLTCLWAVRALWRTRRQLRSAPVADLDLPGPPIGGAGGLRTVERVLATQGASCLETALVTQRWLAAQGLGRDVLIGVSPPGEGFRAHAWLDDPEVDIDPGLTEIHRVRPSRPGPRARRVVSGRARG